MKEKRRCSILFHLLVPGGRWLTTMSRANWLASFCSSRFHSRTRVAAASVGGDQHAGRFGIACPTNGEPPLADAIDGNGGRVMVNADAHPPGIGSEVIDPVRHRPPEFLDQEVMDPDLFRISLRAILAARVAEIADQFLLLGVD